MVAHGSKTCTFCYKKKSRVLCVLRTCKLCVGEVLQCLGPSVNVPFQAGQGCKQDVCYVWTCHEQCRRTWRSKTAVIPSLLAHVQ